LQASVGDRHFVQWLGAIADASLDQLKECGKIGVKRHCECPGYNAVRIFVPTC
jgi:hypothetical protein